LCLLIAGRIPAISIELKREFFFMVTSQFAEGAGHRIGPLLITQVIHCTSLYKQCELEACMPIMPDGMPAFHSKGRAQIEIAGFHSAVDL
jgi:hypothetical protein